MEKRIGTILILVEDKNIIPKLNQVLSNHGNIILARQGLALSERNYSLISLILEGTTDQLDSLSGQLGRIRGVSIKSAVLKTTQENEIN